MVSMKKSLTNTAMSKAILLAYLFLMAIAAGAQDLNSYEKHWFIQNGDTMPFRLLLPENYDARKKYPVVFFLHGRGESGRDNEKQLLHGAKLFLRDSVRQAFPAIVVFPQCSSLSYWSNVTATTSGQQNGKRTFFFVADGPPSAAMHLLLSLTDHILQQYPVKKEQVYVMGLSMGGMGTFELVRRRPGIFAAAVPICGGAAPATATQLRKTKWWIFHGGKDDVVLPEFSQQMVMALRKAKASVQFTLYPNANHNSWDSAFAEPGLMPWLFAQHRKVK